MTRIIPILATAILLLASGCASIYEVGTDMTATYTAEAVPAANTAADEVAPMRVNGTLLFSSNRPTDPEEDEGSDRLYFLPLDQAAEARPVAVDNPELKTGAIALFPDARAVFVVQCYREDGIGDCDLLSGRLGDDGGRLTNLSVLPPPLNDIEWDHHPALSGDGRTLIFASERYGTRGGSDLWISTRRGEEWSDPVNLGPIINTTGNEIAPWLTQDGTALYFASDTHPGMGGFDIYRSRRSGDGWSVPEVLGRPFNSDADDIFFTGGMDADTSWLASNREGGQGGFDIFRVVRPVRPVEPAPVVQKPVVLRIIPRNAYTKQEVNAEVNVTLSAAEENVAEGRGTLELPLEMSRLYTVTASLPGFMNAVESIRTGGFEDVRRAAREEDARIVLEHDILLTPVAEEERKIYAFTVEFDFNLFNIRPEEEKKLDSVALLLGEFPNSTVVISGHTDSVGTNMYNIRLGYNRAKEVSDYVGTWLKRQGVVLRNRMEIRTYGEEDPVASNATEEGRQRNRRVEIAIVRNE